MTSEAIDGTSVVSGPHWDWSGAWVRATAPLPAGTGGPEVVSSFLAEHGGVTVAWEPILDVRRSPAGLHAVESLVKGPSGTPHEDPAHFSEFFRCRGHLAASDFVLRKALFGDVSATTQFNRCEGILPDLLVRHDLHRRLVNGSDYPLPAIDPLIRTGLLVDLELLDEDERPAINELFDQNPLIFDFVLKRRLRVVQGGRSHRLADSVFHTAHLFAPPAPATPRPPEAPR